MPIVRNIAEGIGYQPAPGEHLLQLVNTGETPLYVGIRNGDYMIAAPPGEPQVTYVLVEEQWVRLQQQLKLQITYKNWIASGLLTLVEVPELVPDPPAEEPATEEQPTPESEPAEEQPDAEPTPAPVDPVPESEPAPEPAPEPTPEEETLP